MKQQPSLSSYVRSQAEWREARAEEYPDDERNARSAQALHELAARVADLERADDARVRYLIDHHFPEDAPGAPLAGEETQRAVSRWGFDTSSPPTPAAMDEFVTDLCALAAYDAYEWIRDTQGSDADADAGVERALNLADEWGLSLGDVERALVGEPLTTAYFARRWVASAALDEDRAYRADTERELTDSDGYGAVIVAIRALAGRPVLAQMRTGAAGDYLTTRGVLRAPQVFAGVAVAFDVGDSGQVTLHFDQYASGHVAEDGGVMVRFKDSSSVFRCVPDSDDEPIL